MSAESDFRAVLAAYAPLTALVGTRIAQNAVPQGATLPYVAFTASHAPEYGLDNTLHGDAVTFSIECWAESAAEADAVAVQVQAALLSEGVVCTAAGGTYDPEQGLDATALQAEWWVT
jgi:hypothetical protein